MPKDSLRRQLGAIERAAVHAWPAFATLPIDGWLWRYSEGGSQRANSVATLSFTGSDVEAAIDEAERRYRRYNAAPSFQVSEIAAPNDLDRRLAARGYDVVEPCTTLVRQVRRMEERPVGLRIATDPTADWLEVYSGVVTADRQRTAPRILRNVPHPRAFCAVCRDGRVVSTALAVALEDIVIAECVAVRAEERRRGAATAAMQGVAAWAAEQGASVVALQAAVDNTAAQALYAGLGFERAGSYRMRVINSSP
ncbi:MAG: GNAT family N-acetyltransferase [Hyphomicrobiaceae bacterium]